MSVAKPRSRSFKQILALTMSALVAMSGMLTMQAVSANPASADSSGTMSNGKVAVVSDGTSVVPGDTSTTDGKLAAGNSAGFLWEIVLNEVTDGHLTQTLPEGWSWDESSLALAGLDNSAGIGGFKSSYDLSTDKRTLDVTVSTALGAGGTQTLEFKTIMASTNRATVPTGQIYTPELQVTDSVGTSTVTTTTDPRSIEIVSIVDADLMILPKSTDVTGVATTCDFGAGPEPAKSHQVEVRLVKQTKVGYADFDWQAPMRATGTFSLSQDGSPWTGKVAVSQGIVNPAGAAISLTAADGTYTLDYTNVAGSAQQLTTFVSFCVPLSEVPNTTAGEKPLQIKHTIQQGDWKSTAGHTVPDSTLANNTADQQFSQKEAVAPTSGEVLTHTLWVGDIGANSASVFPKSPFASETVYQPFAERNPDNTWKPTPTKNLNLFDFWNKEDSRLDPNAADPVQPQKWSVDTAGKVPVPSADVEIFYTTDAGPGLASVPESTDPLSLNWVRQADYTGKLSDVQGVRVAYVGNGGVWDTGVLHSNIAFQRFSILVAHEVVRGLPQLSATGDFGIVRNHGAVSTVTDGNPFKKQLSQYVLVRASAATITANGVGLDASGNPVVPAKATIMAGQDGQWTIRPKLAPVQRPVGDPPFFEVTNVVSKVCVPSYATDLNFSKLDRTSWDYTVKTNNSICGAGETEVWFNYLGKAQYIDPLADITFSFSTSLIAPAKPQFTLRAYLWADGMMQANGNYAAGVSASMYATQTNVAQHEKSTSTPAIELGEQAKYQLTWFNFLAASRDKSSFVDVLPYNGDPRGTSVHGNVTLASASLHVEAVVGGHLQLTTDPAIRQGDTGVAPADGVSWINYDQATPEEIANATALRVSLDDFISGPTSIGKLDVTLNMPDARSGDVLKNTATGVLRQGGSETRLGEARPIQVKIESATLTGKVWNDVDRDGSPAGETGLPGVKVALTDDLGNPVLGADGKPRVTTTAANGTYSFAHLKAGKYETLVEPGTITPAGLWTNTADPSGTLNSRSGVVTLDRGATVADLDFGYVLEEPSISVTKTAAGPATVAAGELVSYTFEIENTGTTPVTAVELTDQLVGLSDPVFGAWPDPAKPGTLGVGKSVTATATYPITQADIDAQSVSNTATVTGEDPVGGPVTDSDTVVVPLAGTSSIEIVKTGEVVGKASSADAVAGDTVAYGFTVTNTGSMTLTGVEIEDALPGLSALDYGTWPGVAGTLAPGKSITATAEKVLTQSSINAGGITNTATATGNPPVGAPVSDDDTVSLPFDVTPGISLQKTGVLASGTAAAGEIVEYTFEVKNSGLSTLTNVRVEDALAGVSTIVMGAWPNTAGTLEPGESVTGTATYTVKQSDVDRGTLVNDAKALGTPVSGADVFDDDSVTIALNGTAVLSLEKTVALQGDVVAGSTAKYAFTVTNAGTLTVNDVELSDALAGLSDVEFGAWPNAAKPGVLAPGEVVKATAELKLTQAHIDAGRVENTATAGGETDLGVKVSDDDTATLLLPGEAKLSLEKGVKLKGDAVAGSLAEYTFKVTNSGVVTLSETELVDDLPGLSALEFGKWPNAKGVLAPGESVTATATLTLTQAHVDAGEVVNTASAVSKTPQGGAVTATDAAKLELLAAPGLAFEKTGELTQDGNEIRYAFRAENTGNVTLSGVEISDLLPGLGAVEYSWPGVVGELAPGAVLEASAVYSVAVADRGGDVVNEATVVGTDPSGKVVSGSDSVTVAVPQLPVDPTEPKAPIGLGTLSLTGGSPAFMAILAGLLLCAAGAVIVLLRRRSAPKNADEAAEK